MHLFVYGTLKRGGALNRLLKDAEYMGEAITHEACFDLDTGGSYPRLVDGLYKVKGELYNVDSETLARMDRAEGYPHLFDRNTVSLGQDAAVDALVYTYHDYHPAVEKRYKGPLIGTDGILNAKYWVG